MKAVKKFPIKYKKDIAIKMSFEKFEEFCNQYKKIKIEPDVIIAEYQRLTGKKVKSKQLNKVTK